MTTATFESTNDSGVHAAATLDTAPRSLADRQSPSPRAIVLATDGSSAALAALRLAASIANRDQCPVEALVVEDPFGAPTRGLAVDGETFCKKPGVTMANLGRVRQQLCSTLRARRWNFHVEFGRVGPTIADAATAYRARLIVLGLNRYTALRRIFGSETSVRVLRHASVPVLAVPSEAPKLLRTAVAAIDFSPASLRAAAEARDLLAAQGSLHLVHVRPPTTDAVTSTGWHAIYEAGMSDLLQKLTKQLSRDGITVTTHVESGNIAESVLRLARTVGADLVACGTHGFNAIERLILGSVPTDLLRSAECAVLVAPAPREPVACEVGRAALR